MWRRQHLKQILHSRTALSASGGPPPRPRATGSYGAWTFRRHSGILWGLGTAEELHRNFATVGTGRCPLHPSFPGQRVLGTRSAHPRLAPFFPHLAIALASRRPQRGHRAPPVSREMFQAFPGDYDSGSRCSSSPSAESQYLSSVDSFGSPPTATASQVSSNELGYALWGFNFFLFFFRQGWDEQSPNPK